MLFVLSLNALHAELSAETLPLTAHGRKALLPINLQNHFAMAIDSARAVCFLSDHDGKVVARDSKWVIGGGSGQSGLAAGATNKYFFVLTLPANVTATNLTAKLSFSTLVLEGGKQVDPKKNVRITEAKP